MTNSANTKRNNQISKSKNSTPPVSNGQMVKLRETDPYCNMEVVQYHQCGVTVCFDDRFYHLQNPSFSPGDYSLVVANYAINANEAGHVFVSTVDFANEESCANYLARLRKRFRASEENLKWDMQGILQFLYKIQFDSVEWTN